MKIYTSLLLSSLFSIATQAEAIVFKTISVENRNILIFVDEGDSKLDMDSISFNKTQIDLPTTYFCNSTGYTNHRHTLTQKDGCYTIGAEGFDWKEMKFKSNPEFNSKYCTGQRVKLLDHDFYVQEVVSRCLTTPVSGNIIRLLDKNGTKLFATERSIARYAKFTTNQKVEEFGICEATGIFNREKNAIKCAIEDSRANAVSTCKNLNGIPNEDSVKIEHSGWLCHREAFNEKYCAIATVECKM